MNHVTRITYHNKAGFTLIEAVVSATLFAFVISSIIGVYLSVLRLDSRTRAQRAVIDNGRYIMEFLTKEIRTGRIDYSKYPGNTAPSNCTPTSCRDLYLINQNEEGEYLYMSGTDLLIQKNAGTSNLNSNSVKITKLKFLIAPSQDPLTPAKLANEQPRITVILEITAASARDPVILNLQSTFSEAYYPSRR